MSSNKDVQQRSLEQAEETLSWIRDKEISASPINYSIGYEYVGNHPAIRHQIERIERGNNPERGLEAQLEALYRQHFGSDDTAQLEAYRHALSEILDKALGATAGARGEMGDFAAQLRHSSKQLDRQGSDIERVKSVIDGLINQTRQMESRIGSLEATLAGTSDEIAELKSQYQQVRGEIFTDPLTGVLNRRGLDGRIAELLRNHDSANQNALMMIDLDNFKPLNDSYGHVVGDQVLCFIAKTLSGAVRSSDAVCRYGGDEFAVLLPDTSRDGAFKVASNVLSALRKSQLKRRSTGELLGTITASIGIAMCEPDDTPHELIERADKALYKAKHAGKDAISSS